MTQSFGSRYRMFIMFRFTKILHVYTLALYAYLHISGQIIATSYDLTPNGGLVREIPLLGKSRLVKYYNLARYMYKVICNLNIYKHI